MSMLRPEAKFEQAFPAEHRPQTPVFLECCDTDGDLIWLDPKKIASIQWTNKQIGRPASTLSGEPREPSFCRVSIDTGGEFEFAAGDFKQAWNDVFN